MQEITDNMAYDVYRAMTASIPDGTYLPAILGAIEYMLADILLFSGNDAMQSEKLLDIIKKDVLGLMLKQKEMLNQVN